MAEETLQKLPRDPATYMIGRYLDLDDKKHLELTSHKCKRDVDDPSCWPEVTVVDDDEPTTSRVPNKIKLSYLYSHPVMFSKIISLTVSSYHFSTSVASSGLRLPHVKILSTTHDIGGRWKDWKGFGEAGLKDLLWLDILRGPFCPPEFIKNHCSKLRGLCHRGAGLDIALLNDIPSLQCLFINDCTIWNFDQFVAAAHPDLNILVMLGIENPVLDIDWRAFLANCPNLAGLSIQLRSADDVYQLLDILNTHPELAPKLRFLYIFPGITIEIVESPYIKECFGKRHLRYFISPNSTFSKEVSDESRKKCGLEVFDNKHYWHFVNMDLDFKIHYILQNIETGSVFEVDLSP